MSLKVWLPFDNDLHDQGIYALPALSFNNFTSATGGKIGKCYSGWGICHLNEEILGNEWSVSAWIKADSWYSANNIIVCKNAAAGDVYQIYFSIVGTNQIRLGINNASGITYNDYTFTTGKWHHVVGTYDGKIGTIYINGEEKIHATVTNAFVSGMNNLSIGCRSANAAGTNAWVGNNGTDVRYLNDVRVYDHCLSAEEVRDIANGLILHYKLDNHIIGNPNLAPNSASFDGWTVGTGWQKMKMDSSTVYHYERTGATSNSWQRLIPPVHLDPNDYPSGITVSFDFKCDDFSACNSTRFGAIQIYNASNVRVGWYEPTWTITGYQDGTWMRVSRVFTQAQLKTNNNSSYPNAVIAYSTVTFQLVQNGSIYIKNIKIEAGNTMTAYGPAESDLDNSKEIDCSGYGHHGTKTGTLAIDDDTARYGSSIFCANGANGHIDTPTLNMPIDAITMNIWFKTTSNAPTSDYHMIVDSIGNSTRRQDYEMCVYKTGYFRGGLRINNTRYADNTDNTTGCDGHWHMLTLSYDGATVKRYYDGVLKKSTSVAISTGLYATAALRLFKDGYSSYACINANLSDFRIYCTALLDTEIKKLYNVGMGIDSMDNIHSGEYNECAEHAVHKTTMVDGQINETIYCPYDSETYVEPDGSKWIRIFHHNRPVDGLFQSTDPFTTSVYVDEDKWFYISLCDQITSWELMIKSTRTDTDGVWTRRWVQAANPMIAKPEEVTADLVTQNTSSGYSTNTWGGLYKRTQNSYTYLNLHNGTPGNWYGAMGQYTAWSSNNAATGVRTTGTANGITTGYVDLYVRIDNTQFVNVALHNDIDWLGSQIIER